MKIDVSNVEGDIRLIKLDGRLDLNGTYSVEVEFVKSCAGENMKILVDLSGVNFISSVGIPMLVNTAKSVVNKGGKMVFLNPQDNVIKILELVGVPMMIPIHKNYKSAVADAPLPPGL